MATQLCQKCKQAHPGHVCNYDEEGECAETTHTNEVAQPANTPVPARRRDNVTRQTSATRRHL